MKRRTLIQILALKSILGLIVILACTSESTGPTLPPVVGFEGSAPPQLITEEYLRRQLDIKTAKLWALPLAEAMAGPVHRFPSRVISVQAQTWDRDRTVHLTVVLNDGGGRQRHIPMRFMFNGPNYDTGAGAVVLGACHRLPGAGVSTTGEFTSITNRTDSADTHHVSKTVTESTSTSITLSESAEFTSGITVEAGSDVAKASASFSSTFGISKDQTSDHAVETSDTVEDEIVVPGHRDYAITFTTDDAAVDCVVSIGAPGDWSDLRIWIGFPTELHKSYYDGDADYWSQLHSDQPSIYTNLGLLLRGDALDDAKGGVWLTATQSDQVYRLLMGYDVRCPDCGGLRFTTAARAALVHMSDDATRWISFEGVRHQTTKKDASYTALDVTGQDGDCVSDTLSVSGTLASSLDADGNGTLDACD